LKKRKKEQIIHLHVKNESNHPMVNSDKSLSEFRLETTSNDLKNFLEKNETLIKLE